MATDPIDPFDPDQPQDPSQSTLWSPGEGVPIPGPQGPQGPPGPPSQLIKGDVTTGPDPDFTLRGSAPSYILDMVLPQGARGAQGLRGEPGLFSGVTIEMLESSASPQASIEGPSNAQILKLKLPRGAEGEDGLPGPAGPPGKIEDITHQGTGTNLYKGLGGEENNIAVFYTLVDTRTIKASRETDVGVMLRYMPSYVRLTLEADKVITSPYTIVWDNASGSDTSVYNAGNPTYITIPSNVTRAEVTAQIKVERSDNTVTVLDLLRNGITMPIKVQAATVEDILYLSSGVISVQGNDQLALRLTNDDLTGIKYDSSWLEVKLYT